jgi:hypothetical protein
LDQSKLTKRKDLSISINIVDVAARTDYKIVHVPAVEAKPDEGIEAKPARDYVRLVEIVPCVYPVASGFANEDNYYNNYQQLDFMTRVGSDGLVRVNTSAKDRVFAMLRMAGWDVRARRTLDGQLSNNWAANADGRYLGEFASRSDFDDEWVIDLSTLSERANSWLDLSCVGGTKSIDFTVEVEFRAPHVSVGNNRLSLVGGRTTVIDYIVNAEAAAAEGDLAKYGMVELAPIINNKEYVDFMWAWSTDLTAEGVLIGS